MLLDSPLRMLLLAGSLFSAITLIGLYAYSGSIFPTPEHDATQTSRALLWLEWSVLFIPPIALAVLERRRR